MRLFSVTAIPGHTVSPSLIPPDGLVCHGHPVGSAQGSVVLHGNDRRRLCLVVRVNLAELLPGHRNER